jgi:exopolyphosphatase/guanosine-5'-triphosphate,3'-diphosphate pyrophosphatase
VENLLKNLRHAVSRAAKIAVDPTPTPAAPRPQPRKTIGLSAQGRLDQGPPIAVIDIGSNSVRLVVYEALTRSPTPIFNEKVLAGRGRAVE